MIRIKNMVGRDRISIGLLTATLSSFLVVLTAAATSSPVSIPERLLDRVRGTNKSYYEYPDATNPNCTALAVYNLTSVGTPAVAWNDCGGLVGTLCIQCPQINNYQLIMGTGTPLVFPHPILGVSCNGGDMPAGSSGTCQLIGNMISCNLANKFNCDQYASAWDLE